MGNVGIYARTSVDSESTSIEQQKNAGIEFCKNKNFQYQIYDDIGKSGFKIDNENDPFLNRPGIMKLISDIKDGKIDKVWVWENSRLSRNEITQLKLNQIFIKHNVILYIKETQYNLNNPQNKLIHGIFNQISEYERHNIVERTKRGVHDSINRGIRGFNSLYGYKKEGTTSNGYINWIPVDSEIEKIKYLYEKYLNGSSIYSIVSDLFKGSDKNTLSDLNRRWKVILKQFSYTGFNLTPEGLTLYKKYKNGEIDSIKELNNKKYYVKSVSFPIEIVSIENWIKIIEKLHINSNIYKDKNRKRDNSEIATGIIKCPYCKLKYHSIDDKGYLYYKHFANSSCKQKPKSIKIKKINDLFELFLFYFYLVYDDTRVLIEENQKLIKINQAEIKEKMKVLEVENKDIEEQLNNFKAIYKSSKDVNKLELLIEKEMELKKDRENNNSIFEALKNEYENLKIKYEKDKVELTYFDVKNMIINFFENMSKEEKRNSFIKMINNCLLFNKYLIIEIGKLLFIFNIDDKNKLSDLTYDKFKNDINFKDNFLNSSNVIDDTGILKIIKNWQEYNDNYKKENFKYKELSIEEKQKEINNLTNYFKVRKIDDIFVQEVFLTIPENRIIINEKFVKLGIDYNLSKIDKIISFANI